LPFAREVAYVAAVNIYTVPLLAYLEQDSFDVVNDAILAS
jgi:hypothetical protein